MKRYQSTLTKMTRPVCMALAALLMVGAMASCSENENTETALSDNAYLSLSFSTGTGNSTRAGETSGKALADNETDANPTQENDIKVWVFKSNTGDEATPISYKAETLSEVKNGNYTLNLRFLRKIGGEEVKNIDLYILANSESINMPDLIKGKDLSSVTRKDLKEVSFTSPFGINSDGTAETKDVPAGKGLPISRAITEISVDSHVADTEEGAKNKGIKIPLVRAVSKLHFYFARKKGNDANTSQVKVTKIEVEGNTIPTASYVFPDEATYNEDGYNQDVTSQKYNSATTYVSTALKLAGVENKDIMEVEDPKSFIKKSNQSAQEYLDAFDKKGIKSHDLCYLRETTKAIKGTIYYSLDGGKNEKHETFNIPSDGNAIRNRELVVYGYFLNGQMGKLTVTPTIQEWQDGGTYTFIEKASSEVIITDGEKTDWGYKVAYGKPKFGPMITIKDIDTDGKTWILQTNNPMFGFVKCNACGNYEENQEIYGMNEKGDETILGYTYKIKDFLKSDNGVDKEIHFYVVPKKRLDTSIPHNVKASIFITRYPNDKFFINAAGKFPGSEDGTEIYFEQVL